MIYKAFRSLRRKESKSFSHATKNAVLRQTVFGMLWSHTFNIQYIVPAKSLCSSSSKSTAVFLYSSFVSSSTVSSLRTFLPTTSASSNWLVSLLWTTRQHVNRNGPRVYLVAILGGMTLLLRCPFNWARTLVGISAPAPASTLKMKKEQQRCYARQFCSCNLQGNADKLLEAVWSLQHFTQEKKDSAYNVVQMKEEARERNWNGEEKENWKNNLGKIVAGARGGGSRRLFYFFCNSQRNLSLGEKLKREDVAHAISFATCLATALVNVELQVAGKIASCNSALSKQRIFSGTRSIYLSDAPHKNYRKLHCSAAMALSPIEYLWFQG